MLLKTWLLPKLNTVNVPIKCIAETYINVVEEDIYRFQINNFISNVPSLVLKYISLEFIYYVLQQINFNTF